MSHVAYSRQRGADNIPFKLVCMMRRALPASLVCHDRESGDNMTSSDQTNNLSRNSDADTPAQDLET